MRNFLHLFSFITIYKYIIYIIYMKFCIVVARYNENIEWTKQFTNVIIYNKGTPLTDYFNEISLYNVGREGCD
jgi:hypothetical protein